MTVQRVWQVELVSDQVGAVLAQPSRGMVRLTSGWHPVDPQALFAHFAGGDIQAALPMSAFAVQPAPPDRFIVPSKEVFSCDGIQCFDMELSDGVGAGDVLDVVQPLQPMVAGNDASVEAPDISEHVVAMDIDDETTYFEGFEAFEHGARAKLRIPFGRRVRMWVVRIWTRLGRRLISNLEDRLRPQGLVSVSRAGRVAGMEELELGLDPTQPLLVLIHGFLTTTNGSFGKLLANGARWGPIHQRYAGVVGWDHHTITADLQESAIQLAEALRRIPNLGNRPIHLLCASQGALVGRALVSSAGLGLGPIEQVVMVASPAEGTFLAAPETLSRLVLWVALLALVTQVPGSRFLTALLLVLLSIATDERYGPGVVAMDPGSDFLRNLRDRVGQGPALHDGARYHHYVANFEPGANSEFWSELKRRKKLMIRGLDLALDGILAQRPNDLVVDRDTAGRLRAAVGPRVVHQVERDGGPHHLGHYVDDAVLDWIDNLLIGNHAAVGPLV